MKYDLDLDGSGVVIELREGMAWLLYFDDGPGGPCGQSMRTTCSHAQLHIFNSEDEMRAAAQKGIGRNKKARTMFGVVGSYTANGVFSVVVHGAQEDVN